MINYEIHKLFVYKYIIRDTQLTHSASSNLKYRQMSPIFKYLYRAFLFLLKMNI